MFTYVYLDGIKYAPTHTGLYRAAHHPGALLFPCCSKLVFFCWICSSQHHTGSIQRYPTFVGFCKNDALQIPKKKLNIFKRHDLGKTFFPIKLNWWFRCCPGDDPCLLQWRLVPRCRCGVYRGGTRSAADHRRLARGSGELRDWQLKQG